MREDLELRDYAIEKGWTPEYSNVDKDHGRTGITRADCPHDSIQFRKGDLHLTIAGTSWPTVKMWWNVWKRIGDESEKVAAYNSLREALDRESK